MGQITLRIISLVIFCFFFFRFVLSKAEAIDVSLPSLRMSCIFFFCSSLKLWLLKRCVEFHVKHTYVIFFSRQKMTRLWSRKCVKHFVRWQTSDTLFMLCLQTFSVWIAMYVHGGSTILTISTRYTYQYRYKLCGASFSIHVTGQHSSRPYINVRNTYVYRILFWTRQCLKYAYIVVSGVSCNGIVLQNVININENSELHTIEQRPRRQIHSSLLFIFFFHFTINNSL